MMTVAALCSVIFMPILGKLNDNINSRFIVPLAFVSRACLTVAFQNLHKPDDWRSYLVLSSMVVATVVQNISVDAIYLKIMNKEIRGMLTGVTCMFSQFGTLAFTLVAGGAYDTVGPKAPFALIGFLDSVFVVLFCIVWCNEKKWSTKKIQTNDNFKYEEPTAQKIE